MPIAAALRGLSGRIALQVLANPRVQRVLVTSVTLSHLQLVRLLEDKGKFARVSNGVVRLDLRQFISSLTGQLGLPTGVADRIPPSAAEITLIKSKELRSAQRGVRLLNFLATWLWVLTLAAWAGAVYLVPGRRRLELRAIAIGFVLVGVLVLLVRRLAGDYVVNHVVQEVEVRPAAHDAYAIVTQDLKEAAGTDVMVGLVALFGIWLVGPRHRAEQTLHWLAPYFRRPALVYAVFATVWVLLLLWAPTVEFRRARYLLLMVVLSAAGTEIVRRIAVARYPDAVPLGFGHWVAGLRESFAHRMPHHEAPVPVATQLEGLARLHTSGQLTDAEYAAAKEHVFAA